LTTVTVCRKPVDVGSLLRFKSHVVDVVYKPVQHKAGSSQQGASSEEAHIAVEVAAVISHPEQRDTTHTNTFRWAGCLFGWFRVACILSTWWMWCTSLGRLVASRGALRQRPT
jgi:hypothetical protein